MPKTPPLTTSVQLQLFPTGHDDADVPEPVYR